jgi:arginase
MKISLIYAYWPNQPAGVTWCDLPWALRDKGLPKKLNAAGHEVLETILVAEEPFAEEFVAGLRLAGDIGDAVREAVDQDELAVILAGSCALAAIGAAAGLGSGAQIAWFDAHPDLNTPETTTSGLFEGMALAAATGHAWRAIVERKGRLTEPARLDRAVLFGARDIDEAEVDLIASAGVSHAETGAGLKAHLADAESVYAHLDMDVHDALEVRANSYAVPKGPTIEAVRQALCEIENLKVLAITGLDPAAPDASRAAELAIDHVLSIAEARG